LGTLDNIIFPDSLPTLDIHGVDRETARVLINDFIKDSVKLKLKVIVIIHGIGTGVLKEETIKTLKDNKSVTNYKNYYRNNGMMLVELSI